MEYDVWLSSLEKHLEQYLSQKEQHQQQLNSKLSNSKVSNGNYQPDVTDNNSNNTASNGDNDDDANDVDDNAQNSIAAATEELILQNAKLKTTVDEYKSIVAETVSY